MAAKNARQIAPAQGKLGVLCVGLGAVATTFIAGVENIRRGSARPIGSITQMGTIRLGKRSEKRTPLIRDFVQRTSERTPSAPPKFVNIASHLPAQARARPHTLAIVQATAIASAKPNFSRKLA